MYEICNLIKKFHITASNNSSINFGKSHIIGDTLTANILGGSEVVGDGSNNYDAETNYFIGQKPAKDAHKKEKSGLNKTNKKKKAGNLGE